MLRNRNGIRFFQSTEVTQFVLLSSHSTELRSKYDLGVSDISGLSDPAAAAMGTILELGTDPTIRR